MRSATITDAKNGLSALIDRVRAGESIVITDRGVPVAVLEPVAGRIDLDERIAGLERRGLVRRGRGTLDPAALRVGRPTPAGDVDVVRMVIEEREAGW